MEQEFEKLVVWFNPDKGWYDVFTSDGKTVGKTMKVEVVADEWPEGPVSAKITAYDDVVNDKPLPYGSSKCGPL